jgi:hypothetical protein
MEGRPYEELHDFCDFSLQEQNEVRSIVVWHDGGVLSKINKNGLKYI